VGVVLVTQADEKAERRARALRGDLGILHDEAVRLGYDAALAEVRRVVKGVCRELERRERCANGCNCSGEVDAADEILSRLEKL
jgi:hypothetical protein